ncbi:RNA methyltransferase [Xanthomonadaceae bacterium JHOS43]|nr:RNA methyltransferase [Xanthomonadaceae bacterium JHOS43]MCX7563642.1 RNA methyltransferase [Xanthomonadaceae bacterium XH05]
MSEAEHPDEAISIILVGTSHPGNIGSAARAMRTMGLTKLCLVAPERFPHREASAMAAGADDVLEQARVFDTLQDAVADCRWVMGCTARRRSVVMDEFDPSAAASRIWEATARGRVALVFGRERTGLTNEELQLCHASVHIPSVEDFSSLNLAAAVQVLAWELRRAQLACTSAPDTPMMVDDLPATAAQMESLFGHLAQMLEDIDFHKGRSPDRVMRRLRQLLLRAQPDQREVRVLRGIFADAQRMARLAGR